MNYLLYFSPRFLFSSFSRVKWRTFQIGGIFIILLLLIFYIFQVNVLTQQIYLLKEYKGEIARLSKENKVLEIEFSKTNSLANIDNYLSKENFVKVNPNQVKYIKIIKSTIATK